MPQQLNPVAGWIYSRLASSSVVTDWVGINETEGTWNIYEGVAIQGATFPMIVFTFAGSTTKRGGFDRKVFMKLNYNIVAIDEHPTSFGGVGPIADEIEKLFTQAQDVVDDLVAGSTPMGDIQFPDLSGGKRRNHQGKQVQIFAYSQSGE